MQIFVFLWSCDVRNNVVFLILVHSNLRGVKQKKYKKKTENFGLYTLIKGDQIKKP